MHIQIQIQLIFITATLAA